MDSATLHKDVKNLFANLQLSDETLTAAEKISFLAMAHYIDLPDAEASGSKAIVSGTPNYALTLVDGSEIDRITSAVFVASSVKQTLEDWNIRLYQHAYRGVATTGTPYAFCFYNDEMWLYYIPNLSGTVYFTCQKVVPDLTDFPDSYYPLMIALITKQIYRTINVEGAGIIYARADRDAKDLIKSHKNIMHPKKAVMEKSTYRSKRISDLNSMI